jgi:NitT/TauT family transport system permease protein
MAFAAFFSQRKRLVALPDLLVLLLLATVIYAIVTTGSEFRSEFHPVTEIDLSVWALPRYTILSGMRGAAAYLISLGFTLVVGYTAAKSRAAERVIVPALDILQSIPVLGFLPGLELALIAIFPHSNIGLELAAIISIFTGQVWNMTFSFYASLKSIPGDFREAATVINLGWYDRLKRVELPFSAVNLAWNSLMGMAGGWFFLTVSEASTIGDKEFRLPGVGAYMAVAIQKGDTVAMVLGVSAMIFLIVAMDVLIWRPILAWVQRFRLEDVPGVAPPEPLMQVVLRESRILRWVKVVYRRLFTRKRGQARAAVASAPEREAEPVRALVARVHGVSPETTRVLEIAFVVVSIGLTLYGASKLVVMLAGIGWTTWFILFRNTIWTLIRVTICLILSTIWAVPVGIWIGTNLGRTRAAQPIVQILASFPAPMLYPLALAVFLGFGLNFDVGSTLLMLLGVQWYVLFNVIAGALRIPQELRYALALMESSRWAKWRALYLPAVFPALVTGWVTAAGGAWNASIVAEVVPFRGQTLRTGGLGATISDAAGSGDFKLLAAALATMVIVVLILNRTLWARVYHLSQTRFRLDIQT